MSDWAWVAIVVVVILFIGVGRELDKLNERVESLEERVNDDDD